MDVIQEFKDVTEPLIKVIKEEQYNILQNLFLFLYENDYYNENPKLMILARHDERHILSVLKNASNLLNYINLNEDEIYALFLSILVHDLGLNYNYKCKTNPETILQLVEDKIKNNESDTKDLNNYFGEVLPKEDK